VASAQETSRNRGGKRPFNEVFDSFASLMSKWTGHSLAFSIAVLVTVVWALSGPIFHYSNTWQLIINTGTTVLTFLMVFILQNTMNRDAKALHLKIDELIRVTKAAHNSLMGAESRSQKDLDQMANSEKVASS
jgi:low affinity Fe/Cu permease